MNNEHKISPIVALVRWLALLLLDSVLAACIHTEPRKVDHSFHFDAPRDSPEIEILDYVYGDPKGLGVRTPAYWIRDTGKVNQSAATTVGSFVGDTLYVKWRIKNTGEVYQDTVDLRRRLPADMKNQDIYFIVKGARLHVYLISEEKLDPSSCKEKREKAKLTNSADDIMAGYACYLKYIKLHPDPEKQ